MANPFAGEVAVWLDGQRHVARLTLGALAALESDLGEDSMVTLVERFETGRFASRDVLAVLVAGLKGAGWQGEADDLVSVQIRGGAIAAAQAAAQLLARAFHTGQT